MDNQKKAPTLFFFGAVFFVLFIGLRTMTWLMLDNIQASTIVIPHVLTFSITRNLGIAFGIQIGDLAVIIFSILLTIACLIGFCLAAIRKNRWPAWGMMFVSVGAISNALDRIQHGAVIDYLQYPGIGSNNIADILITIGVSILVIYLLTLKRHARPSHDSIINPPAR